MSTHDSFHNQEACYYDVGSNRKVNFIFQLFNKSCVLCHSGMFGIVMKNQLSGPRCLHNDIRNIYNFLNSNVFEIIIF